MIHSMKPSTSSTATGSFMPASPSSERARRRFSVDPRSRAKIAAPSVAETIAPTSIPCSSVRSISQCAAMPVTTAVTSVPSVAMLSAEPSTGLISWTPAARPPSKRISASAMTPIRRASSKSEKEISPRPSEPTSMPTPRKSTSPGTRSRPASREAARPSASSRPATRIRLPSLPIAGSCYSGGGARQRVRCER